MKDRFVAYQEERREQFEEKFSQTDPGLVWCGFERDEPDKCNKLKELFIEKIKNQNKEPGTNFESRDGGWNVRVDVRKTLGSIQYQSYEMDYETHRKAGFTVISVRTIGNLNDREKRTTIDLWKEKMKESALIFFDFFDS